MADKEVTAVPAKSEGENGRLPFVPLLLAVFAAVILAVGCLGGLGVWLLRSGKLPITGPARVVAAETSQAVKTKLITLDPLLVNLADEGGHAYLRVGIVLREEEPQSSKGEKPKDEKPEKAKVGMAEGDVLLRDAALSVIGRETAGALLAADGKEHLKTSLQEEMQRRAPKSKLLDVFFTEFLVQR